MFKTITYDVEHGNSHALITPNNELVLIDAGNKDDFSPSLHLKENWGIPRPRWLTITHPDTDHLSDINNIANSFMPMVLEHPNLTIEQLEFLYNGELSQKLQEYLLFRKRFTLRVPSMGDSSWDWGGVQFATFNCNFEDFDIPLVNNLSIVTFARYQGWTMIFPGDLERTGWLKLLENTEFQDWLSRTDIFIASHHGRWAGYCPEVFEICKPKLTIISDKSSSETSETGLYSLVSQGLPVRDRRGKIEIRKALTTRVDGAIFVSIDPEGREIITID